MQNGGKLINVTFLNIASKMYALKDPRISKFDLIGDFIIENCMAQHNLFRTKFILNDWWMITAKPDIENKDKFWER